jgi:hypothetical protein
MKGPLFYSKILLFGEYGIIKGQRFDLYIGALRANPSAEIYC